MKKKPIPPTTFVTNVVEDYSTYPPRSKLRSSILVQGGGGEFVGLPPVEPIVLRDPRTGHPWPERKVADLVDRVARGMSLEARERAVAARERALAAKARRKKGQVRRR